MVGIRDLKGRPIDMIDATPHQSAPDSVSVPAQPVLAPRSLPDDFETGLQNLEAKLAEIAMAAARVASGVERATTDVAALRARAGRDIDRLATLDMIEKALR